MMNDESFNNITTAIKATNDALSLYAAASERSLAAVETVEALQADVEAVRANTGLSPQARTQKFGAANNALVLSQADAKAAQDVLLEQKSVAVRTGKAAAKLILDARDLLRIQRVKNASDQLTAEYDWSQIYGVRVQDVANAHRSVIAIAGFKASQLTYELQHDDTFVLEAVRHLSEHWNELRPLVEAEPNLTISIPPIAIPPPIVMSKPVVGNQLGTLSQAQAAAA